MLSKGRNVKRAARIAEQMKQPGWGEAASPDVLIDLEAGETRSTQPPPKDTEVERFLKLLAELVRTVRSRTPNPTPDNTLPTLTPPDA